MEDVCIYFSTVFLMKRHPLQSEYLQFLSTQKFRHIAYLLFRIASLEIDRRDTIFLGNIVIKAILILILLFNFMAVSYGIRKHTEAPCPGIVYEPQLWKCQMLSPTALSWGQNLHLRKALS